VRVGWQCGGEACASGLTFTCDAPRRCVARERALGPLGYNVAKAIAIIVVLFWNFGVNRVWTYRGIK